MHDLLLRSHVKHRKSSVFKSAWNYKVFITDTKCNLRDAAVVHLLLENWCSSVNIPPSDAARLIARDTQRVIPLKLKHRIFVPFKQSLGTFKTVQIPNEERGVITRRYRYISLVNSDFTYATIMTDKIFTLDSGSVPQTQFLVHTAAKNPAILQKSTSCDPVCVSKSLVIEGFCSLTRPSVVNIQTVVCTCCDNSFASLVDIDR